MAFTQVIPGQRVNEVQPLVRVSARGEIKLNTALSDTWLQDTEWVNVYFDPDTMQLKIERAQQSETTYQVRTQKSGSRTINLRSLVKHLQQSGALPEDFPVTTVEHAIDNNELLITLPTNTRKK